RYAGESIFLWEIVTFFNEQCCRHSLFSFTDVNYVITSLLMSIMSSLVEGAKEKGQHSALTLWGASVDHSSGVFALRRWRRFTSPRIAVTINCASLSPSSLTNSISFST